MFDVQWVRARFPGLSPELAFFENAGGSVPVDTVVEAATRYLREDMVQLGASYARSQRATQRVHAGIDAAASLIGAPSSEVALTASSTMSAYLLSHAFAPSLGRGDEIVVTTLDHECNRGAWTRMADARGATLREWEFDAHTHALTLEGLERVLSTRTRLVCFTHCSNVVGTLHDAATWVRAVHAAGALAVVDGVAFAPHRRVDVAAIGADAYLVSLYKVYGPHVGLLHVAPALRARLQNQNHAFLAGSGMYELMPGYVSHELAASLPGIAGYLAQLDAHHGGPGTLDGAFHRIAQHEAALCEPLLAYLASRSDVRVLGEPSADPQLRAPTITFVVEGRASRDVVLAMDASGIAIRHGHFYALRAMEGLGVRDPEDGVVRVSMAHYNTAAEVERLIAALDRVFSRGT